MERIVFLGAGNVATHLAYALSEHYTILQVYAPHIESAADLADKVGATPIISINQINAAADIYVVSIKDDVISSVLANVITCHPNIGEKLWIHTAGSVSLAVFTNAYKQTGVLYPLQTFSKDVNIAMSQVPFFTEGSSLEVEMRIQQLAKNISPNVYHADSLNRRQLHIAGVLGCNMPMYLWALADKVLHDAGYSIDVLRPLLQATLDKAMSVSPVSSGITGPARRGDTKIIQQHIESLSSDIIPIYRFLSNEILREFNHKTIQ